jgi:hypothetical protein
MSILLNNKFDNLKFYDKVIVSMTTPVKKYQNVSYKELLAFSEHNPNRSRTLASLAQAPLKVDTSLDKLGLKGYTAASISPSGILSILACIADPNYYALAPKHARTHMLIELSTSLQEQTDKLTHAKLVRKRKKIHDLIGAAYNGAFFEDKEYMELFHAIGCMRNLQFVLMKEAVQDKIEDHETEYDTTQKGEIIFSSPPNTWKHSTPTWVVDYRAQWVAVPTEQHAVNMNQWLSTWLSTVEQKGWTVQWPEVDSTKSELIDKLIMYPDWKETDRKMLKETLATRLGRLQTMSAFTKWTTKETALDESI